MEDFLVIVQFPNKVKMYFVASDLFEVVDKRAKSVVGENSDEQLNVQSPGITFTMLLR